MKRPTTHAHEVVTQVVRPEESVIDATAGNGHDTLFLARLVGERGRVLAFDVQAAAIEAARRRVEQAGAGGRVGFFEESHAKMAGRSDGGVAAVMFNLGYLPGGDHAVITRTEETVRAVEMAAGLLREGGVVTIVCYPGHPGGDEEAAAVVDWARARGGEVFPQAREGAPFLVVVRGPSAAVRATAVARGD